MLLGYMWPCPSWFLSRLGLYKENIYRQRAGHHLGLMIEVMWVGITSGNNATEVCGSEMGTATGTEKRNDPSCLFKRQASTPLLMRQADLPS